MRVSELCLGTMTFGGEGIYQAIGSTAQAEADRMVGACRDAGINFFDTADIYSMGRAEEILGRALGARRKEVDRRDQGARPRSAPGPTTWACRAATSWIRSRGACGGWAPTTSTSIRSTASTRDADGKRRCARSTIWCAPGKVRYLGASNLAAWQLMKALGITERHGLERFETLQAYYSIAGRDLERELVPLHEVRAGGPAHLEPAGGRLSGRQVRARPEEPHRDPSRRLQFPARSTRRAAMPCSRCWARWRASWRSPSPRLALAWLLHQSVTTSVIIGARNDDQLRDNLAASEVKLSPAQLERLDRASALPAEYPGWMVTVQSRDPGSHPARAALRQDLSGTPLPTLSPLSGARGPEVLIYPSRRSGERARERGLRLTDEHLFAVGGRGRRRGRSGRRARR